MTARARAIDDSVLSVLSAGRCDGFRFYLPATQLDRKLYEATNKVLDALGGKWNRSAKAHVFAEPCESRIESAIETGEYTRPADMGWFPTPAPLAERIVAMAGISPGMLVLEPSAGEGAIVHAASLLHARTFAFEIEPSRADKVERIWGATVTVGDFLAQPVTPIFDRVVMNPPFAKRADIHHVLHAFQFLKPGGRLVAIMSGGVAFREDRLTQAFRERCDTIEALPDDSFKQSGTNVRTVVVTMERAP